MLSPAANVVVGGRYVLVRPLAKGGMGSVWVARHRDLDVDVSVKFMARTLLGDPELRLRFEREAKVAARLRSQHIVQVLDFGFDDGTPYIAMELLQGESLADRLNREPRLSLSATATIVEQVCKALRTAHQEKLVHRDLKPGNVFLAKKDHEEVVKVLDFGIVKDANASEANEGNIETATGLLMGSVHYMSPEQIRSSRQVDARSDLWSVAVIAYKMLTGNVPFPGTNQGDVMVRVCTDPFPPPSYVVPGLSKTVDAFFERAFTRDPAGRYQSAEEMAMAFAAVSRSVSIVPGRPEDNLRGLKKTLPLFGPGASALAALDAPSTSSAPTNRIAPGQTAAPTAANDPSFVSAVMEPTQGTFQAVTMPNGQMTSSQPMAMPLPQPQPRGSRILIIGAALGTFLILGIVAIFVLSNSGDSPAAANSGAPSASTMGPVVSAVANMPTVAMSSSGNTPPSSSVAAPPTGFAKPRVSAPESTAKTPATTTTKTGPNKSVNPLDIAD